MNKTYEEANKYSKEWMDNGLKAFAAMSKNFQTIAAETSEFSKKSFENGSVAMEKLSGVKTFDKAVEVQTDFAKNAYEGFVAQATRMGELYADMAKEAYKPFENTVTKATK